MTETYTRFDAASYLENIEDVAEVAGAQTIETGQDPQTALPVLQPTQPTIEVLGGENLEHVSIIVDRGYSGQSSPRGPLLCRSGREGRSCAARVLACTGLTSLDPSGPHRRA